MCNLKERKKKGRMEEVEEGRKGRKEGKKKRDTEKENEKKIGKSWTRNALSLWPAHCSPGIQFTLRSTQM